MFNLIKTIAIIFTFLSTLIFANATQANKDGVIMIPIHNWPSQIVGAKIIGKIFEKVGEKVEYIETDSQGVYELMADGDIDIVHEVWEGAFGLSFESALATGNIIDLKSHDAKIKEDWWYPSYIEDLCPGLPSWRALTECYHLFAREDSLGKGVFITGPKDWAKYDSEKIKALGMNFEVRNLGSANAVWDELSLYYKQKKPIIIFNWEPNFIGAAYKGKFIEFPKYNSKCVTDASWGINPNSLYDCEYSASGYIKIAVNIDFEKNHPEAYKTAKKINFSTSDISKMANYIATQGYEYDEAAEKWLDDNKSTWSLWIK